MMAGQVVYPQHESSVLKNNPLGDPHIRRFPVYLPPGYDDHQAAAGYPVIFGITGFTGYGDLYLQGGMFRQPLPGQPLRLSLRLRQGSRLPLPTCVPCLSFQLTDP